MTDEELDKARSDEAWRIWRSYAPNFPIDGITVATIGARLAREGWMPIDPDLIKAREICGDQGSDTTRRLYNSGRFDDSLQMRIALASIKYGRSQGNTGS